MINGYYLATNKASAADEVVYVRRDKCFCVSASGTSTLEFDVFEWKNFIGPITYDLFKDLRQDINALNEGCGQDICTKIADNLIKRISPQNV